ncbi:MAG TPA: hypothetical protein VJT33_09700 [bacterium]|nr:hypothetical protein [bacterium]
MGPLAGWENFYVIVGSSAGALIGLQFVVMTLIADTQVASAAAGSAFATPTVMHFAVVLLLSAILSAPWPNVGAPATLVGLLGLSGVVYCGIVSRRMRGQTAYRPDFEDWLFHAAFPVVAYALLAVSGYAAGVHMRGAPFGVGAAVLVLLFVGIHNAWDAVTWHVFVTRRRQHGG